MSQQHAPPLDVSVDGRTARRDRNKVAVLDAVLELFDEGNLQPSVHEVAERSGVSLRSVYRYFDDAEDLIREAIARVIARAWPIFKFDGWGEGDLDGRIERIVESRLALYEAIAPAARAANMRAAAQPILEEGRFGRRESLRRQVSKHFEPEFSAMAPDVRGKRLATIDALMQFEGLELMRQWHDVAQIKAILTDTTKTLLTG